MTIFWHVWTLHYYKLLLVVDTSSDLRLIILFLKKLAYQLYYVILQSITLQRIILRIISSYHFESNGSTSL